MYSGSEIDFVSSRDFYSSTMAKLASAKMLLTPVRKQILAIIKKSGGLVTAKAILSTDKSLDKVTVYRTLETFLKAGLVREFHIASGEKAYELGEEHDHHHHFHCDRCLEIYHLPCEFDHAMENFEKKSGFKFETFDFRGVCEKCLKL